MNNNAYVTIEEATVNYFEVSENELSVKLYKDFPQLRYMGSKYKLLPWIESILAKYEFKTMLDAFAGSGSVSYMMKHLGKQVSTNDFLHFSYILSKSFIENSRYTLEKQDIEFLLSPNNKRRHFIRDTFKDVFFDAADLDFLDNISANIILIPNEYKRALAYAALFRSCIKKQPRGVFTICGNLEKYNDGRRDLRLSIKEHFIEQVDVYNRIVFSNGYENRCLNQDVFTINTRNNHFDLVYMDPPYVPQADDNCYVKRYHFLEGLSCYWENEEIQHNTKVKKIKKKYSAFSYRKTAIDAFDNIFKLFKDSTLALSYSSNAFPDLNKLIELMSRYKQNIDVYKKKHRYHFGNHSAVKRSIVDEYIIIGT